MTLSQRLDVHNALQVDAPLLRSGILRISDRPTDTPNRMRRELIPAPHLVESLGGRRDIGDAVATYGKRFESAFTDTEIPVLHELRDRLTPTLSGFYTRAAPAGAWSQSVGVDMPAGMAVLIHGPPGTGRTLGLKSVLGTRE